jgi:5S rRNA maturation endonuclease (ribonuclease M5)
MKGREMPITIRGIIIPADWDEKGRVVAVAVSGQNEQEYLIDKDYKGRELMHYIEEEVEVRGIAREAKDKKMITVQKYILKKAPGQEGIP